MIGRMLIRLINKLRYRKYKPLKDGEWELFRREIWKLGYDNKRELIKLRRMVEDFNEREDYVIKIIDIQLMIKTDMVREQFVFRVIFGTDKTSNTAIFDSAYRFMGYDIMEERMPVEESLITHAKTYHKDMKYYNFRYGRPFGRVFAGAWYYVNHYHFGANEDAEVHDRMCDIDVILENIITKLDITRVKRTE